MSYRKRTGNGSNWYFTDTISKTFSRRQASKDPSEHKRKGSSQFFMDLNSNEQEEEKQSLASSQTSLMSCQQPTQSNDNNTNSQQTSSVAIELSESHPRIRPLRPETKRRPSSSGSRNGNLSTATSPAFTSNVSIDSLDSSCDQSMMITSTSSMNPDPPSFTPPRLPPKSNPPVMMADLTTSGPPEASHRTRIKSVGSNPINKPRMNLPSHDELSSPGSPRKGSNDKNGFGDRQAPPPVVPRKSLSQDRSNREEDVYKNINSVRPNRRPNI